MNKERNIAIVTGGSKGIGKSISLGLAKKNTDLIITYFRDKQNEVKTSNEIIKLGVKCYTYKVDLSKLEQVEKFCEEIKVKFKQINFLINNAATGINKNSLKLTSKHWDWVMNTNSKSPWILSKNLSEIMPKNSSMNSLASL